VPWQQVRESVDVKLFEEDGELYVLAKSTGRQAKETAMRRKRLVRLLPKLYGRCDTACRPAINFSCGWARPKRRRAGRMALSRSTYQAPGRR